MNTQKGMGLVMIIVILALIAAGAYYIMQNRNVVEETITEEVTEEAL
jgi:uncharacterized protein (UPF0333 family)